MKLLKVLNHDLGADQIKDLKDNWGVTDIVNLPDDVAKLFSQVSVDNYNNVIAVLNDTIKNINPDIMVIQGHMGVVHNVINDNPNVIPLLAMTQRVSIDKKNDDGTVTKTSVFKHQQFIKY